MWLFLLLVAGLSFVIYFKFFRQEDDRHDLLAEYFTGKNWTNDPETLDTSIRTFTIGIPDSAIEDLHRRLDNTKMPTPTLEDYNFDLGMKTDAMIDILKYWRDEYSWRENEKVLNTYNHFKTTIEGLEIHFLHIKPENLSPGITPKPLLMLHGWPGSFYEFYKAIPMLIDPLNHGGNETDVFELVIPSIPGYGFSDAPKVSGFNSMDCARIFHKVMLRLEYKQYYVQGGDWGSVIAPGIARLYPSCILGIHTNMAMGYRPPLSILKFLIGSISPYLFYHPLEAQTMYPLTKIFKQLWWNFGYLHHQATTPDSIGYGLSDSPSGLAAYILEKFVMWTNGKYKEHTNLDEFYQYFTKDEILTNISIYWWSGNITSSLRFYYENLRAAGKNQKIASMSVCAPAGFIMFPHELVGVSKDIVEHQYPNLVSMTYMEDGGHFGCFQMPKEFVKDIRQFVSKVQVLKQKQEMRENSLKQELADMPSHLDVLKPR